MSTVDQVVQEDVEPDPQLELLMATGFQRAGKMEDAINSYELANATDQLIACGDACVDQERFALALRAYEAVGDQAKLRSLGEAAASHEDPNYKVAVGAYGAAGATGKVNQIGDQLRGGNDLRGALHAFKTTGNKTKLKQLAAQFLEANQYDLALEATTALDDDAALVSLGDKCVEARKMAMARQAYEAAENKDKLSELGIALWEVNRKKDALAVFVQAEDIDNLEQLGRSFLEVGKIEEAKEAFAAAKKPITPEMWIEYADELAAANKTKLAVAMYQEAGAKAKAKIVAIGDKQVGANRYKDALAAYGAAGAKGKLQKLGKTFLQASRLAEADAAFKAAGDNRQRIAVGKRRLKAGSVNEALEIFAEAGYEAGLTEVAEQCLLQGEIDRAEELYQSAGKRAIPVRALVAAGRTNLEQGELVDIKIAVALFRRANKPKELLKAARALLEIGSAAGLTQEILLEADPEEAREVLFDAAIMNIRIVNDRQARQFIEHCGASHNFDYLRMAIEAEQPQLAEQIKAVGTGNMTPDLLRQCGQCAMQLREERVAIDIFTKLQDADALVRVGNRLIAGGIVSGAREAFQAALRIRGGVTDDESVAGSTE